ncbi:MAG: hypothetical protein HY812_16595 [Planctomycetes bacterium]|nr:hypothetical protein [Planctomycetota bacterium]
MTTRSVLFAILLATGLGAGSAAGSQVTPSDPVEGKDGNGNPTTTVTFTVVPGAGEEIRDFHVVTSATDVKLPSSTDFGQPDGWNEGTKDGGTYGKPAAAHWTAPTNVKLPQAGGTFSITVRGAPAGQTWSWFEWTTSSNGEATVPKPGKTGYVASLSGGRKVVPVKGIALAGPANPMIADTSFYLIDDVLDDGETVTATIYAAMSLDPADPTKVNMDDPIPGAWGIDLSTNSRTGTLHINSGTVSATVYGGLRNFLLVEIPDRPALIGGTFYLQAFFSNGDATPVLEVTISAP